MGPLDSRRMKAKEEGDGKVSILLQMKPLEQIGVVAYVVGALVGDGNQDRFTRVGLSKAGTSSVIGSQLVL